MFDFLLLSSVMRRPSHECPTLKNAVEVLHTRLMENIQQIAFNELSL